MGDHFSADLFGAVAAAFVFADADADGGVGGKGGREKVEDAAVVPPDGGGGEQVVFEAVGGSEEGIESEQCAEGVSEQGLFFGVDGVFGGEGGDEILKNIILIARNRSIKNIACEMGYDQRASMEMALKFNGFKSTFYKDLAGFDRGFCASLKL